MTAFRTAFSRSSYSVPLSTTLDCLTRRRKADNQVTQFSRPIERQEVSAAVNSRRLDTTY